METLWGALGTVIAIYVLLRAERIELRGEIRTLDERLSGDIRTLDERLSGGIRALDEKMDRKFGALDEKFDRKFDGLTETLAASGALNRPPQPPA